MKRKKLPVERTAKALKRRKTTAEVANTEYQYQPLDSRKNDIRLVNVKAGNSRSALNCEIQSVSLLEETVPDFEAVSYCWGDPTQRERIRIAGLSIDIPKSSEEALRNLRLPKKDRCLWIDAVCINQKDDGEHSSQVTLMGQIYRRATGTAIWLGEADDSTEHAIEAIDVLLQQMRHDSRHFSSLEAYFHDERGGTRYSSTCFASSCDTEALEMFFGRPWFRRLWFVQEVVLGRDSICYCGRYQVNWIDVSRAAICLVHKDTVSPISLDKNPGIVSAANIWTFSDREEGYWGSQVDRYPPLCVLLQDFELCLASDPRDKVYGLLGLRPGGWPKELMPDYNDKSVNTSSAIQPGLQ